MGKLPGDRVFVDTSFFKGLIDPEDDFHDDAVLMWQGFEQEYFKCITSNFILDETMTLLRIRCGLEFAKNLRTTIMESRVCQVKRVTIADEKAAWDWFLKHWEGLSFTDCVSFAMMRRLGFRRVATFDKHFEKAGFEAEGKD